MRYLNLTMFLVTAMFLSPSCSADREINSKQLQERADGLTYAVNEEEPFSGIAVKLYKTEQKKVVWKFENGLLNGPTTEWYSDGQKKSEVENENGSIHGLSTVWFPDGQINSSVEYKKGEKHGIAKEWYPNGQQRLEEEYIDSKKSGSHQEWYENGQLLVKKSYNNDLSDGLLTSWYDNGQKQSEGNFKQEKPDGQWHHWYDNGQKMRELSFKDGLSEGLRKDWYESGNEQFEGNYKNDKQDGKCTFWFENGQMSAERIYKNGDRNGLCIFWYENGQTKRVAKYRNDKIVSDLELWKENGDEIGVGEVTDVDGNKYLTVEIGDQWWMMENLKVTRYRNLDPIPNLNFSSGWHRYASYNEYNNDSLNVDTYGLLYNNKMFYDRQKRRIAPKGWHISTKSDWLKLVKYLGGKKVAGSKLKEAGLRHWKSPNTGATNESGFNALPGGKRIQGRQYTDNYYERIGQRAYFWCLEYVPYKFWPDDLYAIEIFNSKPEIDFVYTVETHGYSIRCVKD